MSNPHLGKLERIDVRTAWKSESGEFTPWLAQDENIVLLGEAIGVDLEVEATEKNVGPFRADILCKDTANNNWVLIENQLERTDHIHLGQLITYASGLKAVTIVWVAPRFADEHRAALDWLNEVTTEGVNFFGLEVELWRIGTSPLAPKFNVVSKPNDWSEAISRAATGLADELTETKKIQLEYWTEFVKGMPVPGGKVKPQKPLPQHWATFAIGRSNVHLSALVNTVDQRIGVTLGMTGTTAKSFFNQLAADRDAIESQFGEKLDWREMPDKKESQVGLFREQSDPLNRAAWPDQHKWLRETLEKFHSTFATRVRSLG
jgi:hypothetical protein